MSATARVAFVTPTLRMGGAERILQGVLAGWDRGFSSLRCIVLGRMEPSELELPADVDRTYLGHASRATFPRTVSRLASTLSREEPDAIISSMWTATVAAAWAARLARPRGPLVAWEHIGPREMFAGEGVLGALKIALLKDAYRVASRIVAVSDGVRGELVHELGVPSRKVTRTYNGVDVRAVEAAAEADVPHPWLRDGRPVVLSVGRLDAQKDYPTLLRAMARIRDVDARLVIVGDGPERGSLTALARRLGIEGRCLFVGRVENPYGWMSRSTLLVLPSRFEGLALVLLEALALGVPVVATDCRHGPAEVLADGSGRLVPVGDVAALARQIDDVLADPAERRRLSTRGRQRASAFSLANTVRGLQAAVADAIRARARSRRTGP